MLADYQLLVREQLICGMQVHVGIGDPDVAVALIDRVSRWLPPLLALSASSPFAHTGKTPATRARGRSSGRAGPPPAARGRFASAAEYDALVRNLIASGVISDRGMIYFDVRPSAHVPTIELRVCDACPSVDTVVLIAGLFRAVVARELARCDHGGRRPPCRRRCSGRRCGGPRARGWKESWSIYRDRGRSRRGCWCAGWSRSCGPSWRRMATGRRCTSCARRRWRREARRRASARPYAAATESHDVVDLIVAETCGAPASRQSSPRPPRSWRLPSAGIRRGRLAGRAAPPSPCGCARGLRAMEPRRSVARCALEREEAARRGVSRRPGRSAPRRSRSISCRAFSPARSGAAFRAAPPSGPARWTRSFSDIYGEAAIVRDGVLPGWMVTMRRAHRAPGRAAAQAPRRVARRRLRRRARRRRTLAGARGQRPRALGGGATPIA